jgi:hypothetical protein
MEPWPTNPGDPGPELAESQIGVHRGVVHYADASSDEILVNERIIQAFEILFTPEAEIPFQLATGVFRDLLMEARKLHRMEKGEIHTLAGGFEIRDLLKRVPIQRWPLPGVNQCLDVHCNDFPLRANMDIHLSQHKQIWQRGVYSEASVILASIMGTSIIPMDQNHNTTTVVCPVQGCYEIFESIVSVDDHVRYAHGQEESELYESLGAFWLAVVSKIKTERRWPTVEELMKANMILGALNRSEADIFWNPVGRNCTMPKRLHSRTSEAWDCKMPTRERSETILENIIKDIRRFASSEGANEMANLLAVKIWNQNGVLPQEVLVNKIGDELEKQKQEWMRNQEAIKQNEGERIWNWKRMWRQQREEEDRNAERREQEETNRTRQAREWIEETTRGEGRRRTEEEQITRREGEEVEVNNEDRIEFWLEENPSNIEIDVSEHEELQEEQRTGKKRGRKKQVNRVKRRIKQTKEFNRQERDSFEELEEQWPVQVARARELTDILLEGDLQVARERLEDMLSKMKDDPIPAERKKPQTLEDPVMIVLAQNDCHRICRSEIFCPYSECNKEFRSQTALMQHIRNQHSLNGETVRCPDSIRYYIARMFTDQVVTSICTEEGVRIEREWDVERCHFPNCRFVHEDHQNVKGHAKRIHQNDDAVKNLGWFWGTLRDIIKEKKRASVKQVLNDGEVLQCGIKKCGKIFEKEVTMNKHFAKMHSEETKEEWESSWTKVKTETELISLQEKRRRDEIRAQESREQNDDEEEMAQTNTEDRGDWAQDEEGSRTDVTVRNILTEDEKQCLKRMYIEKRMRLMEQVDHGVNLPQMSQRMMKTVKVGLKELFKYTINPKLEEWSPIPGDCESWLAFEGVYEEAMDEIRKHVCSRLGRNKEALYGERVIDPKMQELREKRSTELYQNQETRMQFCRIRKALEEISEGEGPLDEAEDRRRKNKWTEKIVPILKLIPEHRRIEAFGTRSLKGIWQEMNTEPEHRTRVIQWLDSFIFSELAGEIEGISQQMHAQKVQEAYRTTKGIAMRRYIDKKISPPCDIERQTVQEFFGKAWAQKEENFVEAEPESPLFLEKRIPNEANEEMEEYMIDEKNIREVINSRKKLGACGPDGLSNQIFQSAEEEAVKFLQIIVKASVKCRRTISSWKEARSILLYKKGDRKQIKNWRPISITNCVYRIFTCLMTRCFQEVNEKYGVYTDSQKGFIRKTNGCSEHGILLNELFQHAKRKKKSMIITAIDFTNAFGSVPHNLILSTMRQRNFPEWTRDLVADMYEGASSTITVNGVKGVAIPWNRGVKQGCPLSPLLFNLCIEPLLQLINRANKGDGMKVQTGEDRWCEFIVQAYADDVIFISENREKMQDILSSLEGFVEWSKMEVNAGKCATASYLKDRSNRRCSLKECLSFKGQDIPNLTLDQSLRYLGTPLTARKNVKLQAVRERIREMETLLERIMKSPLLVVQKIDAIKTFLLPSIDFMMLNGDAGKHCLQKMDQRIRGMIDAQLKIRGMPIECHHMSWRDGGLSYPSLVDRSRILTVRSFSQMALSKDGKIREVMEKFTEEEREIRRIGIDTEGTADFLLWKNEKGTTGTTSIIARTRKAARELGIRFTIFNSEVWMKRGNLEFKTSKIAAIGRFLTQKIVRARWSEEILKKSLHGASFYTLKASEISNRFLTDIYTKKSDALFRFAVGGRADCLPTPANIQRWQGGEATPCRRCERGGTATLAHILNRCTVAGNWQLFTKRHNRVVEIVRKAINSNIMEQLEEPIRENTPALLEGIQLSEEVRLQRPDLIVMRKKDGRIRMEIIEVTCPYGRISKERNTLESLWDFKMRKYQKLAQEVEEKAKIEVRIIPVIVSSLGAVFSKTMVLLKKLLKCEDNQMKKIGRKMAEAAIYGSFEVWRQYISSKERPREENEEAEEILEAEVKEVNRDLEDEEEAEGNDQEETGNEGDRTETEWNELVGETSL